MNEPKKKLTLTIDPKLIDLAKQVAEARGESLSAMVENFLREISADSPGDWLQSFHARYLPEGFVEPSDERIKSIRAELIKK